MAACLVSTGAASMRWIFSSISARTPAALRCSQCCWVLNLNEFGRSSSPRLVVSPTALLPGSVRCLSVQTSEKQPNLRKPKEGGGGGRRKSAKDADVEGPEGTSSREDIRALRLQKVDKLRAGGIEPYAYNWDRTHTSDELQQKYIDLPNGVEAAKEDDRVSVAGRITARRAFGKLAFLTLRDDSSTIQLYCEKARLTEEGFEQIKGVLDIGDIIGAEGTVKRTEKGELSVYVDKLSILTKSLLPLPEKWHGLTDIEKRYRQRYVDMIVNPDVAGVFRARAKITSEIRRHMEELGYLEIETPVLQGAAGGADARPFVTFHNALGRDLYLRIATELHLKRMVVGGFERVFEIGRIFRNEGISTRHNPEFTSIEMYQAYADYHDMMNLAEDLVTRCAMAVNGKTTVTYQGTDISFERPWRRASMHSLVQDATGIDFATFGSNLEAAKSAAVSALSTSNSSLFDHCSSVGHVLNEVFETVVEKTLIQPTFVMDHPVEISPLAKPHRSKPGLTERFELFMYGREMANAFSELTDPVDQRERLEGQLRVHTERMAAEAELAKAKGDHAVKEQANEAFEVKIDEDFVTALEYGMPPTAGMGIGIDRLVMVLTDSASIRDVIAFPILKSQ
ncbi:lysyl-tRNA synthetase, class II [Marchantia polymorpha subsp. ruderalis]|uniref:Lysine--tRNA ligase n=2 Tax=Marchantia polymorpha TaxID=3197 RepID=A0A176WLD0_MARPO|nr:hypothetical protein AXG93_2852s1540 [Marchantia polymorpha subsp. ruderalis]PTQ49090.1 hypothetical protein MARPO_0003s0001 [Marchantia polymorpha]BBN16850.1 hypothetical protein Mp_7g09810 [Marchantia polymorpha subsp. ruderalis]|eukprot:PTQ49090.1 hypothetical protein MARPO_0003s0001 [Marchantia polymorpha]